MHSKRFGLAVAALILMIIEAGCMMPTIKVADCRQYQTVSRREHDVNEQSTAADHKAAVEADTEVADVCADNAEAVEDHTRALASIERLKVHGATAIPDKAKEYVVDLTAAASSGATAYYAVETAKSNRDVGKAARRAAGKPTTVINEGDTTVTQKTGDITQKTGVEVEQHTKVEVPPPPMKGTWPPKK